MTASGALERAYRDERAAVRAIITRAWKQTDWPQIAALYGELARHDPSPVVTVNRAVAVGFAAGPEAGLELLADLEGDPRLERRRHAD